MKLTELREDANQNEKFGSQDPGSHANLVPSEVSVGGPRKAWKLNHVVIVV